VASRGAGALPGAIWHFHTHTNELVPCWARGPGAEFLEVASTGRDGNTGLVGWGDRTRHHDNTDVARAMERAMDAR
jgi:alkaline phosphatase